MSATEAVVSQAIQICSTVDFGERQGSFSDLCFASLEDYKEDIFPWVHKVQIVEEANRKNSPNHILNPEQMQQIARFVLPKQLTFRKWQRLFSLARDGHKFDECMKRIHTKSQTLLVVRSTKGEIFGGYADSSWEPDNYEYHGGEQTKIFSFVSTRQRKRINPKDSDSNLTAHSVEYENPDCRDDSEEGHVKVRKAALWVYRWTGANRYFQYCDGGRTLIGFGGGGARFGLSIEKDFRYGSTGSCDTFQNEALGSESNFRVADVEIWGFVAGEETCCSLLCFQPTHPPDENINWIPPVRVRREPSTTEKFILSQNQMNDIAGYVLPQGIAACRWKRVYSLARDGDSFEACVHLIRKEQRSLMVIRTSENEVFGGYAESPWRAGNCNYYGSAQACLWSLVLNSNEETTPQVPSLESSLTENTGEQLKVYRWTGINRYIQYCDITHQILAFGGGGDAGSFGLCVEKDFQMGSTGPCATFGNEPLCKEEHFKILDLEIWGFMTGKF